ncbi:MAG: GIY-YIG nuclease family protein [Firmicutes bacterium]|nr:GIY-YIG nuclease family protein [Bacillota bacterium]
MDRTGKEAQISAERKKELREQYLLMKPDIGIFAIVCKDNGKYYLEVSCDLKSAMNSTQFKLNAGMHPEKELQRDWQRLGENQFEIKVLEQIEPEDQDGAEDDYQDDLALLRMIWVERLAEQNIELY